MFVFWTVLMWVAKPQAMRAAMNALIAGLILSANVVAEEARHPDAVPVFQCTFGDDWDVNYDGWPDRWVRKTGSGLPHYVNIAIKDDETAAVQRELASRHPDARAVVLAIVERFRGYLATEEGRDWVRITSQVLLRAPVRQAMLDTVADGLARPLSPSLQAVSALVHEYVPSLPPALVQERGLGALQFRLNLGFTNRRFCWIDHFFSIRNE